MKLLKWYEISGMFLWQFTMFCNILDYNLNAQQLCASFHIGGCVQIYVIMRLNEIVSTIQTDSLIAVKIASLFEVYHPHTKLFLVGVRY